MREPEQPRCPPASRWRVQAFSVAALALACLYAASCGGGGGGGMETPGNPVPQISSASPDFALVGAGDTTVTVTGSGFISSSSVMISGTSIKTTFVSSAQLTAIIPAADQTSVGKLTLSVANPPPGGGASAGAEFDIVAAALNVTIIDLPLGTAGSVTVTRPDGSMVQLTASATVSGSTGTYTVAAAGVAVGNSTYYAVAPAQTANISTGNSASVTVDYYDIIPNTTKVLDQAGMQSLAISPDGSTLTISAASAVAESLAVGDVLASAPASAAPNGLLVKVLSVTSNGSEVVVTIKPATLEDAAQQAAFTFKQTLSPSNVLKSLTQVPGVGILGVRPETKPSTTAPAGTVPDSCTGNPATFVQMYSVPLVQGQQGGSGTATASESITANGQIEICPSLEFDFSISSFKLDSFKAVATLGEHADLTVQGEWTGGFGQRLKVGPPITFQPILVFLGDVPLYLEPSVQFYVGASGDLTAGFSAGISQDAQAQGGVSYANGQLSPIRNVIFNVAPDPLSLDASLNAKGFAGAELDVTIDGVLTPHLGIDGYLQLTADVASNPWWTLSAGLEGDVGVKAGILGYEKDWDVPDVFDYSVPVTHAPGPFSLGGAAPTLASISPNMASAGSPDVTLEVTGSNFVPDSVVNFNGSPLATTFMDTMDLSAVIPATDSATPGVFPVAVTNPDTTGATSAALNFTVTGTAAPVLTSVSPTSIVVGSFTLSVVGTNFVSGAQVFFGGTALATTFVSSTQLTASGTANVSQVGSVAVTATNPGSGSSNALTVTVANVSGGSSGSTGIIVGNVNGKIVDKAYVPLPNSDLVSVINVDAASGTNPVVTSIPMPTFYSPSATAADQTMLQVVAISDTSPDVQIIDASQDKLIATLASPVTQSATFSAGFNLCMICGVSIDPTSNTAILDTAQGLLLLNLTTQQFSAFIPGSAAGENFGYNPNTLIVLNPTYYQNVPAGLQAISLSNDAVSTYSMPLNSNPDSAAVDLNTNIAVIPDEYTGNQFLINMAVASFSSGAFSAPDTVYNTSFTNCITSQAANEWTMVSIESSTHILFLGTEFGECAAVEPLPTAPVSSAPSSPTTFNWGHMPSAPDGLGWSNGTDPHGIGVFTSVVNGKAYGFLVRSDQAWVARIDLVGVAGASPLSGGLQGQVDLSPYVTFFKTQ